MNGVIGQRVLIVGASCKHESKCSDCIGAIGIITKEEKSYLNNNRIYRFDSFSGFYCYYNKEDFRILGDNGEELE